MISIEIIRDKDGNIRGLKSKGHAEYAESGSDIVCAAVSMLLINSLNAIEKFSSTQMVLNEKTQEEGIIDVSFTGIPDEKASVILDTMLLGLNDTAGQYGKKYLKLIDTISTGRR